MANDTRTYTVRLKIDGKEIPNAFTDLQKAQRGVKKELKGLEEGTDEYIRKSMQLNQINQRLDEVRKRIDSVGSTWKKQSAMWQRAKSVFAGTFAALSVEGAIGKIQDLAVKTVQFIKQLTKQRREITRLTDVTGHELDVSSAKIQSIMDTYQKGFDETLIAANALSKAMKIDLVKALELMQDGFANGADSSGEFLDQLKEYPVQLQAVGLTAGQSIAIITQMVKEGVFSDKGIDAIKEAKLRLGELTPATRDALDAIGISSKELEKQLRTNSISFFEAIQMVSRRLGELQPQSVEVGTAIADIFGGPGEDAGLEVIKLLGNVDAQIEKTENATSKLADANERLAMAYQTLADEGGLLNDLEIGLKDAATAGLSLLDIFQNEGFWTGIKMLVSPGVSAKTGMQVAINRVFDEDMKNNPPTAPTQNIPQIVVPIGGSTATPGSVPASAIERNPELDPLPDIASVEDMVLELGTGWETLSLQMKFETGELYDALEEATDEYTEKFKDKTQEQLDADIEFTEQSIENAEARARANADEIKAKEQLIKASILQGMQAVENAETVQDYGNAVLGMAKRQIQAVIAEGIAKAIAAQLGTGPLGIFTAAAAGIAAQALFAQIIPSFHSGGPTGSRGMGYGDQYGEYAGMVHKDEYVLSRDMLRDPYVANVTRYIEDSKRYGDSFSEPRRKSSQPLQVTSTSELDAKEFKEAVAMFSQTMAVLQKHGIPAKLTDRTLEDIDERNSEKDNARNRGSLL